MSSKYQDYLILGDRPARHLNDGARRYAVLAADILATSPTPFVLGIFVYARERAANNLLCTRRATNLDRGIC